MSDTYRIVGTGNIEMGTTGVGYTAVGQIQSSTKKTGGAMIELKTRKGNTFMVVFFDEKKECSLKAIWDSTFTLPARGDAIALCGLTSVLVLDITEDWNTGKEKGISINATQFSDALVVA